jgi:hypothetical protein
MTKKRHRVSSRRLWVLLVGASAGEGSGPGPRVELLDRIVLEDQPGLGIVRQQPAQRLVQLAADRALEIGEFHDPLNPSSSSPFWNNVRVSASARSQQPLTD